MSGFADPTLRPRNPVAALLLVLVLLTAAAGLSACGSSATAGGCAGAVSRVASAGAGAKVAAHEHDLVTSCPDYETFLTDYNANPHGVYAAFVILIFCSTEYATQTPSVDFDSSLCSEARAADPADLGSAPGALGVTADSASAPTDDLPASSAPPTDGAPATASAPTDVEPATSAPSTVAPPTAETFAGPYSVSCDVCGSDSTAALTVRNVTLTPIDDGLDDQGQQDSEATVTATVYNASAAPIGNLAMGLYLYGPNSNDEASFDTFCVPAHGHTTVSDPNFPSGSFTFKASDISFSLDNDYGNATC